MIHIFNINGESSNRKSLEEKRVKGAGQLLDENILNYHAFRP